MRPFLTCECCKTFIELKISYLFSFILFYFIFDFKRSMCIEHSTFRFYLFYFFALFLTNFDAFCYFYHVFHLKGKKIIDRVNIVAFHRSI